MNLYVRGVKENPLCQEIVISSVTESVVCFSSVTEATFF